MKKYLLICGMIFFLHNVNAQVYDTTWSETFDGGNCSFISQGWSITSDYAVNGTKSIIGDVPFYCGDSIILTSPMYDFSDYGYVKFSFSHICKVSPLDIAKVQYRIDAVGSGGTWKDIPISSYKSHAAYFSLNSFSALNYSEWAPTDSLAVPDSTWWKDEVFDLSNQISYERAQIRFVLRKTARTATQVYFGWLIDNIKITAAVYGIDPPICKWETLMPDTVNSTGPYLIKAKVISQTIAPLVQPQLCYKASNPDVGIVFDTLLMTAYQGDSIWQATIPQFIYGTTFICNLMAKDTLDNSISIAQNFLSYPELSGRDSIAVQVLDINSPADSVLVHYNSNNMIVVADIKNTGIENLVSCRLAWSLNGVVQDTDMLWTGLLKPDMIARVQIGTYQTFKSHGKDTIEIWAYNPNGDTLAVPSTYSKVVFVNFCQYPNSVSLKGVSSPNRMLAAGSYPVKVLLCNKGYLPLDSCMIVYAVNGGTPIVTAWKGYIEPGQEEEITLNQTISVLQGQTDTICAWVSMPNGVYDSLPDDDTIETIISSLSVLFGRYIIGTSVLADFPDFDAFVNLLKQIGMNGHVILAFENGTYPSLDIAAVASYMTTVDTLTVTSVSGFAEDVAFLGNATFPYGIQLAKNKNIYIKRITSKYCISFTNSCDNVEIAECVIDGVETLDSAYIPEMLVYLRNGGVKKGQSMGVNASVVNMGNLRILNNVFKTVSTGINLSTTMSNAHVTIVGNEITYNGLYGIYATGTHFNYISDNKIIRNKNTKTDTYVFSGSGQLMVNNSWSVYNIYLDNVVIDSAVTRNRSISYGGAGGAFGENGTRDMYFKNVNSTVFYPAIVSNNEITRLFGGYNFSSSITNYGIVLNGGNNINIYHNTVYMNPASNVYQSSNYALYGTDSAAENVVCKNNIFISKDYPVYNLPSSIVMDNNNYYSLTDKSYSVNDRHAQRVAPVFRNDVSQSLDVVNYLVCPNAGINEDKNGKTRGNYTTMGAYEEDLFNNSAAIFLSYPEDTVVSAVNMQVPVKAMLVNAGRNTLTNAVLGWSLNGMVQDSQIVWNGNLSSMSADSVQIGTYTPKMNGYDTVIVWVKIPNNVLDSNTSQDSVVSYIYGTTDLNVAWSSKPDTVVFDVDPHEVSVCIHSISGMTQLGNIYLHYTYADTNNIVKGQDSVFMTNTSGEIWTALLSRIPYWHKVSYSLILTDYIGNIIYITDSFDIRQLPSGIDSVSVAVENIVSPTYKWGIFQGIYPIKVVIQNRGSSNLQSCKLCYSVNGGTPITYNWIGNLYTDFRDTVIIGAYNAVIGNKDNLTVWVEEPNGLIDSTSFDDTLSVNLFVCGSALMGVYTIGDTATGFSTINEGLNILKNCGMSGTVTLLMDSGTYDGFSLVEIADVMKSTDTLIITSASGRASDVVFVVNSGNVVTMGGNSNICLRSVTLDASAGVGQGILFVSACDNVEISDCIINVSTASTLTSASGIQFTGSATNSGMGNLRILDNTINGGFASCYFQNTNFDATTMQNSTARMTIRNNKFIGFKSYGIYTKGYTMYDWITDNEFISAAVSSAQYGIYTHSYCQVDSGIVNNKILLNNISGTCYGIYVRQMNTYAGNAALIANNEIRKISGAGTFYGIYNYYGYVDYLHNSIYNALSLSDYGFQTGANGGFPCNVKNNIFHVNTYPVYGTLNNIQNLNLDYNDYYSSTCVGYAGAAQTTIAAWTSRIGKDYNSISVKPIYKDSSVNLDIVNYDVLGTQNCGVNRDIAGRTRYAQTTMGAYTMLLPDGTDLEFVEIIHPQEISLSELCIPNDVSIRGVIKSLNIQPVDFSATPMRVTLTVTGSDSLIVDTVVSIGVMNPLDMDTIEIFGRLNIVQSGVYHLTAALTCAADTSRLNDTADLDFNIFRVELPVEEVFSNGMPNTIEVWESNVDTSWVVVSDSNTVIQPQYGSGMLTFAGKSRGAEGKLYVKYITLYNSYNPTLEFWYYHDTTAAGGKFADITDVRYTVDGGNTFEKLIQLRKNNGSDHGWKKYTLSLLPANGNTCVVIMFDAMRMSPAEYDGTQYIDRIRVFIDPDMAVSEIFAEGLSLCNMNGNLKVVLENTTNQHIDFALTPTSLQVDVTGATTQIFSIPLTSGDLDILKKDTLLVANNFSFNPGTYYVNAKILTSIDNVLANDDVRDTIIIHPSIEVAATQVTGGNDNINCIGIGNPVNQVVVLENDGNMDMEDVILTLNVYDITGAKVQTIEDTLAGVFAVNQTTTHTFAEAYEVPADAMYNVEVVANPMCNAGLTYTDVLTECVDQSDVEVTAFINPTDDETCSSVGANIKVKVRVSNNHPDEDIQGVVLNVVVSANNAQIANWTETLSDIASDSYIDFEFPQGFNVPAEADYTIVAYVNSVDSKSSNDTLSITKCTDLGVIDQNANAMFLGQNIPNPAKTQTVVNYQVPTEGTVVFTLTTVTGQVIYTQSQEVEAGRNSVVFNTENLAAGIYFYTMDFNGQRLTKKVTVKK